MYYFVGATLLTIVVASSYLLYRYASTIKLIYCVLQSLNNTDSTIDATTVNPNSLTISYSYIGNTYQVTIPYNKRYSVKMAPLIAELLTEGQTKIITQQAGIPYLVSSEEMGGQAIIITNSETGDVLVYKEGMKPGFCDDLL
jgi:hypothetical protein